MSLKQAVASARKDPQKSSTTKTPAFYNRQKRQFVHNMVTHINPIVRAAALICEHCPASNVNKALLEESDQTVVRSILMSNRASIKTIEQFIETPMANAFDDDEEVTAIVSARIAGDDPEPVVMSSDDGKELFNSDGEDEA